MNKLREAINFQVAVIGALALTAFSGFVSESAEAYPYAYFRYTGSMQLGCNPLGTPYCDVDNMRFVKGNGDVFDIHGNYVGKFPLEKPSLVANDEDFDSVSNQAFSTTNEEFFTSSESFLLSDDLSLQSQSINEPSNKLGLIALGAFGIKLALKRKRKYSTN